MKQITEMAKKKTTKRSRKPSTKQAAAPENNAVHNAWNRVRAWWNTQPNRLRENQRPRRGGATEGGIRIMEQTTMQIPSELETLLLLGAPGLDDLNNLVYPWRLFSTAEIVDEYKSQTSVADEEDHTWEKDEVRQVNWSTGWIPIATDHGGGRLAVDLDPGPQGVAGQVIEFYHGVRRVRIALSISEFLANFAQELEQRGYYTLEGNDFGGMELTPDGQTAFDEALKAKWAYDEKIAPPPRESPHHLIKEKRYDEALATYEGLKQHSDRDHLNHAECLWNLGRRQEAIQHVREATVSEWGTAQYRLVDYLTQEEEYEAVYQAAKEMDEEHVCSAFTSSCQFVFMCGLAALETGHFSESVEKFERVISLEPGYANAWYNLACAQACLNQKEAAITSLGEAIAKKPELAGSATQDPQLATLSDEEAFTSLVRIPR